MEADAFRYDGRSVLVIGAATGMGAAAAQAATALGATVTALDVAKIEYAVQEAIEVDLRDRASVDGAADRIGGPIDAVFSCAGVADGTPGLMLVNFIAQRHLLERLRSDGKLAAGGGIVMISSIAGLGWQQNLPTVLDFLDQPDWAAMAAWIDRQPECDNYGFSKQAINAYVAREGFGLLQQGVRINAVLPGPTDTPLARANADTWLGFGADYRDRCGIDALSPAQVAAVMVFLASPAASAVNGVTLAVDAGHLGAGVTGSYDDPIIKMLAGIA